MEGPSIEDISSKLEVKSLKSRWFYNDVEFIRKLINLSMLSYLN